MNASFHVVKQMFLLSFNDFNKKMSGSYFGFFWLLANPLITIILYWFVFQIGFKSSNTTEGIPFVPWLICGMVPWFYFSEALSSATSCFFEYSYLVKKVVFRIGMLPIVKVISAIFIHLFFLIFTIIIVIFYDIYPELYILQLIYYIFCLLFLLTGLSLLTSSIVPFFKDLSQIVSIALQLGFWITPIVWSLDVLPDKYLKFFKLNPLYYIAEGYRDSFLGSKWFWEKPGDTFTFWIISFTFFLLGIIAFKKLKKHFSDIL